MPYVSRDDNGAIDGMFANKQPGFAEEYLPDDNPEVMAFLNPPPPPVNVKPIIYETTAQILGVEE